MGAVSLSSLRAGLRGGSGTSGQGPVCCLSDGRGQQPPAERKCRREPGWSRTASDPALILVPACVQGSGQTEAGIRLPE